MSADFVVGLDIGTTTISVLIGEVDENGKLRVIGASAWPSEGIRKGVVVDIEKATRSIRSAVDEAERMAGVEVEGVCVGLSGPHIQSFRSRGVIAIPVNRSEVTRKDVERVTEAASSINLPMDREIIHALPQDFLVDDQNGIKDPVGMSGMRLEAEVHIVTALKMPLENQLKVIKRAGLEVIDVFFSPIAAAKALLTEEEKEMGCVLLDIGGGVTNYLLYQAGCIRSSGVVVGGGINVTNDLAIGLRVHTSVAETLKIQSGLALASLAGDDDVALVPGPDGGREVRRQIIGAIIEPRYEEIFTIVKRRISNMPYYKMLGGGIVLTGGGSMVEGVEHVAEQVFDLPVRKARPYGLEGLSEVVCGEDWGTVVGLLMMGIDKLNERAYRRSTRGFEGLFKGLKKIASFF